MRLSYLLPLALFSAGCPTPSPCGPSNCRGCCTSDGICQTGVEDRTCGVDGLGCNDCASAMATCTANHVCLTSGAGGGTGGAGGAGGGSNGGGGGSNTVFPRGVNEQQLISGSRLKAVRFVGADGAQAPYASVFWDNQLQIACSPGTIPYAYASYYQLFIQQDVGTARCYPSVIAFDFSFGLAPTYGNATCTQPILTGIQSFYRQYFGGAAGAPASPMGIFSPANVKYGLRASDAGVFTGTGTYARATRHTGGAWSRISDGGCSPIPYDGGYDYYVLGADVPDTEFVEMSIAIDP